MRMFKAVIIIIIIIIIIILYITFADGNVGGSVG